MIGTMPRPRKSSVGKSSAGKRKPYPSEQTTDSISSRVPNDQKAAMEFLADRHRRTGSAELSLALENYLRAHEAVLREAEVWPTSLDSRARFVKPGPLEPPVSST